ncbi:hypothetical protein [Lyngbya confervoides]|uniref:Uncharacterized protein n=1 Tax=Lyngbya confervoides BDU141951 TaxID=1574623 RepID=A0ABD4SZG2_9CYAN|nr:hypothetical protein [Lyngbya confervoides]MCM1981674.1 hypothetical protein [Lyngbya confervoides BDU141951]
MNDPYASPNSGENLAPSSPSASGGNDYSLYLQDLKLESANLNQKIRDLRSQTTWLKVLLSLLIILLGGSLAWVTLRLQALEQKQIAQSAGNAVVEQQQLDQIQTRIQDLERQIPANLADAVQDHENQIRQLEVQLEQIRSQSRTPVTQPPEAGSGSPAPGSSPAQTSAPTPDNQGSGRSPSTPPGDEP